MVKPASTSSTTGSVRHLGLGESKHRSLFKSFSFRSHADSQPAASVRSKGSAIAGINRSTNTHASAIATPSPTAASSEILLVTSSGSTTNMGEEPISLMDSRDVESVNDSSTILTVVSYEELVETMNVADMFYRKNKSHAAIDTYKEVERKVREALDVSEETNLRLLQLFADARYRIGYVLQVLDNDDDEPCLPSYEEALKRYRHLRFQCVDDASMKQRCTQAIAHVLYKLSVVEKDPLQSLIYCEQAMDICFSGVFGDDKKFETKVLDQLAKAGAKTGLKSRFRRGSYDPNVDHVNQINDTIAAPILWLGDSTASFVSTNTASFYEMIDKVVPF